MHVLLGRHRCRVVPGVLFDVAEGLFTNAGSVPVDWTAMVTGAAFVLDTTGSTLAPGASATVHITPLAIPSVPSSPLIGSANVTIHADVGTGFDQTITLNEYTDNCVISGGPTSLNFGDVNVDGGSSMMPVTLSATCHDYQGTGIKPAKVYLGSSPGFIMSAFTSTMAPAPFGNTWDVTFVPIDSVGNPLLGTQSAYLSIAVGPQGTEPICDPAFAHGFFVQGTGVSDAADASAE